MRFLHQLRLLCSAENTERAALLNNAALEKALKSSDLTEFKAALEARKLLEVEPGSQLNFAVVLALLTLLFQAIQFAATTVLQIRAREDSQWRTAIGTVSLQQGPKALAGALNVQTFYGSNRYGEDARRMVAASLPMIDNPDGFDQVFFDLLRARGEDDQNLIFEIPRAIGHDYDSLFDKVSDYCNVKPLGVEAPGEFEIVLSAGIKSQACDDVPFAIKSSVMLREWEIDSTTSALAGKLRQERPMRKGFASWFTSAGSFAPNLSMLVLRLDDKAVVNLRDTNLKDANFTGAYMAHVDLSKSSLAGADLRNADMRFGELGGAQFTGAKLAGADLGCAKSTGGSGSWERSDLKGIRALSHGVLEALQSKYAGDLSSLGLTAAETLRMLQVEAAPDCK
jgi:Pentapeptide repeats (8 copies)